jgi:hypothetical protein
VPVIDYYTRATVLHRPPKDSTACAGRASPYDVLQYGVWRSLASASGLGPEGRRFESCHPDHAHVSSYVFTYDNSQHNPQHGSRHGTTKTPRRVAYSRRFDTFSVVTQDVQFTFPLVTSFGDQPNFMRAALTHRAADRALPHGFTRVCRNKELSFDSLVVDPLVIASHRQTNSMYWEVLLGNDDVLIHVTQSDTSANVAVQARTPALAMEYAERYAGLSKPFERKVASDEVAMEFCHLGGSGVRRTPRKIVCPTFEEVHANYTPGVAATLERLCRVTTPAQGRLVLMWGAPGTGKTTAVRAVAREWAAWCKTSYVLDPEALFGSSEYFHEVTLAEGGSRFALLDDLANLGDEEADEDADEALESSSTPEWRLLVVEDADELISVDAKVRAGQALSRLLNLTDGIVGQGMRTIVLITTNEPLSNLHPALSRPGRCLAQVEVGLFSRVEAHAWLSHLGRTDLARALTKSEYSLAELYEVLGDSQRLAQTSQITTRAGYL